MEVGRGPFTVLSINGNTFLGGSDIDWYLVNWILDQLDQLGNQAKKHLREDYNAIAQLRAIAEQAKHQLSDTETTTISIPVELCSTDEGQQLELSITRSQLQDIVKPFIADTFKCCKQAMADAKLSSPDEIKEVLMVGGQTRMPAIRKTTQEFFGIKPNIDLPPEEVVALGAAVQAAIFAGEVKGMKLYDVVPLSLGVKIQGGVMDTLIPRNTSLPYALARNYSARKGQSGVDVEVYQGEDPDISRNVRLGGFSLENLEMSRDGAPDIQVTFRIDEFGILQVTAKDMLQMGKEESITITDSVRLSDAEIEQIVQSAEVHRAEYAARRKLLTVQAKVRSLHEQLTLRFNERKKTLSVELSDTIQAKLSEYPPGDWDEYLNVVKDLYTRVSG
jgi:molecular chaperone DnaK